MKRRVDDGQAMPLVAVMVGLLATMAVCIVRVGTMMATEARADAAADMVALAGLRGGRLAATQVAQANNAALVGYARAPREVYVVIDLGGNRATARAQLQRR